MKRYRDRIIYRRIISWSFEVNRYSELRQIWGLRLGRGFGNHSFSQCHQDIFVQLTVISKKPSSNNFDNCKKNKIKFKKEMKEDNPVNHSFELLGFLNRDFYKVQKNNSRACLLSFLFWILFCSSCSCRSCCCLVSLK